MGFLRHQGPSRWPRRRGFLSQKCWLGLLCSLVAVILLARLPIGLRSDKVLDTKGWELADLLKHLREHGVRLHAVAAANNGFPRNHAYLTEDPEATWHSMQEKWRAVECIQEWQGTVWVGKAGPWFDVEDELAQWGEYGCRIGDFIFFGDKQLLRRIQVACR